MPQKKITQSILLDQKLSASEELARFGKTTRPGNKIRVGKLPNLKISPKNFRLKKIKFPRLINSILSKWKPNVTNQ
jgi:hypothetical protein